MEDKTITRPDLQPHILGMVDEAQLSPGELLVFYMLPTKKAKGGKFIAYYKAPWGSPGAMPKTLGYLSKGALAMALWAWAGPQLEHRVKL
jgi:hypothetical protein